VALKESTKLGLRVSIQSWICSTTLHKLDSSRDVQCAGVLMVILLYFLFVSSIGLMAGLTRPQPTPINGGSYGRNLYGIK
jgi:hypothetical protein